MNTLAWAAKSQVIQFNDLYGPSSLMDCSDDTCFLLTLWRRNYFLILAHSVYKMWIIQEPNTLDLWNELHFEEKKTESIYHV